MKELVFLFLVISSCTLQQKTDAKNRSFTTNVDSYEIEVVPSKSMLKDSVGFLILDGSIRFGNDFKEALKETRLEDSFLCAFVKHTYFSNRIRRRDFVPTWSSNTNQDYVTFKLAVDSIVKKLSLERNISRWVIVGHSLSGLYALNELKDSMSMFNDIISLSPSLWVDNYSYFSTSSYHNEGRIILGYSKSEVINKIKTGVKKFEEHANTKNYKVEIICSPIWGHNAYVKDALKDILLDTYL